MRYAGQSFEVDVPLTQEWIASGNVTAIRSAFDRRHHELFDFNDPEAEAEIVNLCLIVSGQSPHLDMGRQPLQAAEAKMLRRAPMRMEGDERQVPVFARDDLAAGHRFFGPAIVAQEDTTCVIPTGIQAYVDGYLNLHLQLNERHTDV